jgi:uncharacterized membrane protein
MNKLNSWILIIMNVHQLKTKIFILKAMDTIFVLVLVAAGIYSVFYAENKEVMIVYCLIGLYLVNALGRYTYYKVALMHIQIESLTREHKREEQRTLMRTRHTVVR